MKKELVKPLKVIFLGSAHPLRGGLAAYNERLALEFQQQGHHVTIYTFSLQYPSFLFPGKTQFSDSPKPANLKIKVNINSVNPLNWLRIGFKIRAENPDMIIVKFWIPFIGPSLGTIIKIAKWKRKVKVISILDNVIPHEKRVGDLLLTKYFINSCDAFMAMSKSVEADLRSIDNNKPAKFCPHPIFDNFGPPVSKDEAKDKLQLSKDVHYILFFGFVRAYKGLDLLIDAMADGRVRKLGIKLIVAGEYYQEASPYLNQIKDLQLTDSVINFNTFIPDEEVACYFCAADLVVQPYKSATQSGITQIGYHFDKPMVVTNIGGLPEIIPDGKVGYVIAPDSHAIADAIVDFYENNRERFFVENVIHEKKKYSWEAMYNKIVDLYSNIQ